MYLKTIELIGFKSFPDKTLLDFTNGVTAIVGPNGSGKSNISDAIRWVLGEMRAKHLRGGSMQDVIFSGTEKRKPQNFAEVSITIDNGDKALKIDFSEIMITRRIHRSGDSEYFINKTSCRARDINELFMDTGLGRDGYSIVGQGKIDEIISGKPNERRVFFEEAAGISKYRHKKDEAERKLGQTNDNLVRILDIANELDIRLPGLKSASEKAEKWLRLKAGLKEIEIRQWCRGIKANRDNFSALAENADNIYEEIKAAESQINLLDDGALQLSAQRRELDEAADELNKKEKNIEYTISTYQNQIALYENEIARNNQDIARLLSEKDVSLESLERFDAIIRERQAKIGGLREEKAGIETEIKSFDSLKNKIGAINAETAALRSGLEAAREKKSAMTVERNTIQGKIVYLTDSEKSYEGYQKGVKEVFAAHKSGVLSQTVLFGTLADIVKTDKETALAFDAVLGGALQNIVCQSENDAKAAIDFLKKNNLGRVTFLPVSKVSSRAFDFGGASNEKGVVGKAAGLLKFDPKFSGIVNSLLGRTLIVDSYDAASYISEKYNNSFRTVTLGGEVFQQSGAIIGGNILKTAGFMSKSAEIGELRKTLDMLDKNLTKIIDGENAVISEIEARNEETAKLTMSLGELNEKKSNLNLINQSISNEIENQNMIKREKDGYLKSFSQKDSEIAKYKDKNNSVSDDAGFKKEQIKNEEANLSEIRSGLEGVKEKKDGLEKAFLNLQKNQKEERESLVAKEQEHSKLKARLEKSENEIELLTQNLWENYQMSYSRGMEHIKGNIGEVADERKKTASLKDEIRALGDVSVASIEEYKEVNERYIFLTKQKDDLINAKTGLETLIGDMTSIMRDTFTEQFKLINESFTVIFKELFVGGTSSLQLLEPDNVLESGIEINVQPPGKKLESISLLSGGEKAFTAIALLFAVLTLKPLPFCVFDEIEAALDEVNVYKFAEYLKKYKDRTQFILVSHRRGTMENADILYGVTMQEKGVSKLVSLQMHEVINS